MAKDVKKIKINSTIDSSNKAQNPTDVPSTECLHSHVHCSCNHSKKSFASERPREAKQWDYEHNGNLIPEDVAPQSNKKVWWICQHGHNYEASISSRYNGQGCPYCAGKKVLPGFNDLASKVPAIAAEWNQERNGELTAENVTCGSGKKVWWRCEKGHEYEAAICNRVHQGTGCPYCSGRFAIPGENDLATCYPEIAAEWNHKRNGDLKPHDVKPASNKKVWWVCQHGHEYESTVDHRTSRGDGCPYCAGKKVLTGFNSLADTHPEVVLYWDYDKNDISPEEVTAGSHKKIWWICEEGHSYQTSVYCKTQMNGTKCPICNGKTVIPDVNSLVATHPEIAAEWDKNKNEGLKPNEVTAKSNKRVWWICDKGHSYQSPIYEHTEGHGCPYCSGHKALTGFNTLLDTHPELINQWDYDKNDFSPEDITAGSGKKAWWVCEKGHSWQASVSLRTRKNNPTGCPVCSGKQVLEGYNDLATVSPKIAAEWDYEKNAPLLPTEVTAGANKKAWWVCQHGHSWEATIAMRQKTGCPHCAKHKKTSQVEQAVFFYIKQYAKDAINGYKIGSHSELDIFIPSMNIGIEYDGCFYHQEVEKDIAKDKWCKNNGIELYRIREKGCPELDSTSILIQRESAYLNADLDCAIAVLLSKIFGIDTNPDVLAHKYEILENLVSRELVNSVAKKHPLIAKQWNYEKNAPLLSENISSVTHVRYWWKCDECGHEWEDTPFLRCHSKTAYATCPCCGNIPAEKL